MKFNFIPVDQLVTEITQRSEDALRIAILDQVRAQAEPIIQQAATDMMTALRPRVQAVSDILGFNGKLVVMLNGEEIK